MAVGLVAAAASILSSRLDLGAETLKLSLQVSDAMIAASLFLAAFFIRQIIDDRRQIALSLDSEFSWVNELSPKHRHDFLVEMLAHLRAASENGDFESLDEVLRDWKATAEVDADAELKDDLREARATRATQ